MNSLQSTISSKHQVVIPALVRKELKLFPGRKLHWEIVRIGGNKQALAFLEPGNWAAYVKGLGKEIWRGIDIDEYIESLRNEWLEEE